MGLGIDIHMNLEWCLHRRELNEFYENLQISWNNLLYRGNRVMNFEYVKTLRVHNLDIS